MNYFLALLMVIMLVCFVKRDKGEIATPSTIFLASFAISSIMLALNTNIWNYTITFKTVALICGGIIVFRMGCLHANRYKLSGAKTCVDKSFSFEIKNDWLWVLLFIQLCAVITRFADIYLSTGTFNFLDGALEKYKHFEGATGLENIMKILNAVVNAVGLLSLVTIVSNFVEHRRINIKLILLVFLHFVYFGLSSVRIDIIYLFVAFISLFLFIRGQKGKTKLRLKELLIIVLVIALLVSAFYFLGTFTGKSQMQTSVWDNISMYTASSIAALDYKLQSFKYSIENLGSSSLRGIANILSYVGIELTQVPNRNQDFVQLGDMTHGTNIYTCFNSLLREFNYVGTFIILFIEGFIYQLIYRKCKIEYAKGNVGFLVFYAYLSGYMGLSSIAERFFSCLLTLTTICFTICVWILVKFVRKIQVK